MEHVAAKLVQSGLSPNQVLLCERGTSFGYNTLVNDFRGLPIMQAWGILLFLMPRTAHSSPVVKVALRGAREFVPVLAKAAVAVGVAGLFMEVHDDPDNAPSDGPNMVRLEDFDAILKELVAFDTLAKGR